MSIAVVAHTSEATLDFATVTTDPIDTSGANLIVILLTGYAAQPENAVSDSYGNTWTQLTVQETLVTRARLFYCPVPTVGSSHTFSTDSVGSGYPCLFVLAVSGAASTQTPQQSGTVNSSGVTTVQPGSITPAENNELIVAGLAHSIAVTGIAIGSSFTLSEEQEGGMPGALAYQIQTTATARNPAWSWNETDNYVSAVMATFKVAAAGGSFPIWYTASGDAS
jgi:hypothetical protein